VGLFVSLLAAGCGAPLDSSDLDAELDREDTATQGEAEAAIVAGCIRGPARDYVGSAYDALVGTAESFPFVDNYTACEGPLAAITRQNHRIVSDSYELEKMVASSLSVNSDGHYAIFSGSGSVKQTVEEKVKFSRNSLILFAEEEVERTQVTLDASVPFNATFEEYLTRPNAKTLIHNAFGDLYVKTAHLGHRINIVYSSEYQRTDKYRHEDFSLALEASFKAAAYGASLKTAYHSESQVREMLSQMTTRVLVLSHSNVVIAVRELTPEGVKAALAEFRQAAGAPGYGAAIRYELEPFGQHGKSESQFFDWRTRLQTIDIYQNLYHQAKVVADLGSTYKDLTNRARNMMSASQYYIDQYRTPAGYQGSGQGIAAFREQHYQMMRDAQEYRSIVAASNRFLSMRVGGVCLSVSSGGAGVPDEHIKATACSNSEGQLFRYDTASKKIRSVSGLCVTVAGGAATGNLVLASCADSPAQTWTLSKAERKIDCSNSR
jgi:hypothetical protein